MMERVKLGMACFLFGEANFFLVLILTYSFYHVQRMTGPTAAGSLALGRTALFSLALFSSSFTVWRAGQRFRQGDRAGVRLWLAATIALGAVFLAGQAIEYAGLLKADVTISRNLFGATFFTLTGFHGLHVLVGLIALSILLGLALWGDLSPRESSGFEAVSMYWHFVDAVWVVIFSVVYLWAFL